MFINFWVTDSSVAVKTATQADVPEIGIDSHRGHSTRYGATIPCRFAAKNVQPAVAPIRTNVAFEALRAISFIVLQVAHAAPATLLKTFSTPDAALL